MANPPDPAPAATDLPAVAHGNCSRSSRRESPSRRAARGSPSSPLDYSSGPGSGYGGRRIRRGGRAPGIAAANLCGSADRQEGRARRTRRSRGGGRSAAAAGGRGGYGGAGAAYGDAATRVRRRFEFLHRLRAYDEHPFPPLYTDDAAAYRPSAPASAPAACVRIQGGVAPHSSVEPGCLHLAQQHDLDGLPRDATVTVTLISFAFHELGPDFQNPALQ